MPFDPSKQTLDNITQTLINVVGDGNIGTSVPPKLNGEFRVPFVKNLRLGPRTDYFGGTQYTLLWDEPDETSNVSHYNVYVIGALGDNTSPIGPYAAQKSPCPFRVVTSTASVLTFFVQTQLSNGNCSELSRSPSVTALSSSPTLGVIAVNEGGTGQSSYTDGQLLIGNTSTTGLDKNTLTAGANITVTNGPGTISLSSQEAYRTTAADTYILATDCTVELTSGSHNWLLPVASLVPTGKIFSFPNTGAGVGSITPNGTDTIQGVAASANVASGTTKTIRSNGSTGWVFV